MKLRLLALLSLPIASVAFGTDAPAGTPAVPATKGAQMRYSVPETGKHAVEVQNDAEKPKVVFSLLPRSAQKNPMLDMTAITEMTDAGRAHRVVSPDAPEYYVSIAGGFKQMGWNTPAGEQPPAPEDMESIMQRALSRNGYLPSDKEHPAALVVVYHWGSFSRTDTSDPDSVNSTPAVMYRELLERAMLVGGDKFANELAGAMEARFRLTEVQIKQRDTPDIPMQNVMGDAANSLTGTFFDPVEQFMAKSKTTRFLTEHSDVSLYYVIASAFDAGAMAKNQKILLWRTKMTVDASGLSMKQTLPTLIANCSAYFGKEMNQPATVVQRMREGRVELGEPEVISYEENLPAKGGTNGKKN